MEVTTNLAIRTEHDAHYPALLHAVRATFARSVADASHLFTTDTERLWSLYLDNLPGERQVHTCSARRRFVEAFGGLVCIAEGGAAASALWDADAVPEFYRQAVSALRRRVARARATGVFLTGGAVLGTPRAGEWTHFSAEVPRAMLHRHPLLTPGQARAGGRGISGRSRGRSPSSRRTCWTRRYAF